MRLMARTPYIITIIQSQSVYLLRTKFVESSVIFSTMVEMSSDGSPVYNSLEQVQVPAGTAPGSRFIVHVWKQEQGMLNVRLRSQC